MFISVGALLAVPLKIALAIFGKRVPRRMTLGLLMTFVSLGCLIGAVLGSQSR